MKGITSKPNKQTQPDKASQPIRDPSIIAPAPVYCPQNCLSFCSSSCPEECCMVGSQPAWTRTISSYAVSKLCSTSCNSRSCPAKCPPQCCNLADGISRPLPSSPTFSVRSRLDCPALCYKFCDVLCPEQCCSKRSEEEIGSIEHQNVATQGNKMLQ